MTAVSEGTLLGGKLRYRQFLAGHRSGFEPVLLAASIAARPGERVLEAGTGAGAGLLCLGHRVPDLSADGVEIDPQLAELANENFRINGLNRFSCAISDVTQRAATASYDHVFANPPWFDRNGTTSPDPARARAHHGRADEFAAWVDHLAACLKPKGTITLILPAAMISQACSLIGGAGCGGITVFPLWPRVMQPAGQIIISAIRASRAPDRLLAGLVLHDANGITAEADAILRDGAAIDLAATGKMPRQVSG